MKKPGLIHWWELPNSTPVKLECAFLKKFLISDKVHGVSKSTIQKIRTGNTLPRVFTLKRILEGLDLNYKHIEENVTHIQTHKQLISIKFPLRECPEHLQILAHAVFDGTKESGCQIRYKVRFDGPTKEVFRKAVVGAFGDQCYGHTENCYFLIKAFSELLCNHYEMHEFNSKRAVFSSKVISLCRFKSYRVAIFRAAFVDEGYARHYLPKGHEKFRLTLVSSIRNKALAKQLIQLTEQHGLKTSLYAARNNLEFTIAILTSSKKAFYNSVIKTLDYHHRKRMEAEKAILAGHL